MTLANWGGVKAELYADTMRGADATFIARLPMFLEAALQRIHWGTGAPLLCSPLRVRAMRTAADVVITDGVGDLPADYLELDQVIVPTDPPMHPTYTEPHTFRSYRSRVTTGFPTRYTIEGTKILLDPPLASQTINIAYYAKFTTPSNDADTNWLMTNAPTVLFHALRIEAYDFLRNPELMQTAFARYKSAVEGIVARDVAAKASGSPLHPRLKTF